MLLREAYSGTSHERPPKMSSPGGLLWEVVTCKGLDHDESNFFLIRLWKRPRLTPYANADAMFFFHLKVNNEKRNPVLSIEKFPFLILARNAMMLQHLIIHLSLYYLSSGSLWEVKNKGKSLEFLAP